MWRAGVLSVRYTRRTGRSLILGLAEELGDIWILRELSEEE